MTLKIRSGASIVQNQEHIVKTKVKRDPNAEKIQRIALGILGAILLFLYLIPQFRNYVVYGPEIAATIPEVKKTNNLAKTSLYKQPEVQKDVLKNDVAVAQIEKEASLYQPKPSLYQPKYQPSAKINAKMKKEVSDLNNPVLNMVDKLKPPEDEINAKTCGLKKFLPLLWPGAVNYKHAEIIFNCMLNSILSDAHEEVIGQERNDGAVPNLINSELNSINAKLKKDEKIENTAELKKMAGALYPLALLSCYFYEKAHSPLQSANNFEDLLERDAETFVSEYKGQFSDDCSDIWTEELMKQCLEKVWISVEDKRSGLET